MNDEQREEVKRHRTRALVFSLTAFVLVAWIATPFVVGLFREDGAAAGQLGDLYGSINALFSGLAFVGVIVAILLQSQELQLQREELRATRAEAARAAEAQEAYSRLTALSALIQHYHALAQSDEVMRYTVGARTDELVVRLEGEYAKAAKEEFPVVPPGRPIYVASERVQDLQAVPELAGCLPERFVERLEYMYSTAQQRAQGLGATIFLANGCPVVFSRPEARGVELRVLYWKPGEEKKGRQG